MANPKAYALGQFVVKNKSATLAVVAAAVVIVAVSRQVVDAPARENVATPVATAQPTLSAAPAARPPNPMVERCTTSLAPILAAAKTAMRKNDPSTAFDLLNDCKPFMVDTQAREVLQAALVASYRLTALAAEKTARSEKAAKKREGVNIGMSTQDAIDSNWGKPRKVNRTTFSFGTHEQWVYDGGYLYFENGVLTSIQN